jgi:hypothetical protein
MLNFVLIGLFAGLLVGIIPAIYGAAKKKIGIGILGFFACTIAGAVLGLLLAVPCAAIFIWYIAKGDENEKIVLTHKKCIHCAEEILIEAKVCKFCDREQQ